MSELSSDYYNRFSGIARLYGPSALNKFASSSIAVIGLGGVGSWAAEALTRSGIGSLTLFDLDDICISNTNRQLHTTVQSIGKLKTEVMQERLTAINPECKVYALAQFVTAKSLHLIHKDKFEFVIDAIDVARHKSAIIAHCQRARLPLITVGGAGGLKDPTQIQTADLSRTYHDPLLAKVRKQLRQNYRFSSNPKRRFGIEAVFSSEQQIYPDNNGGFSQGKPAPDTSARLDCASGFGAATAVTGAFGFVAATRVLLKLQRTLS